VKIVRASTLALAALAAAALIGCGGGDDDETTTRTAPKNPRPPSAAASDGNGQFFVNLSQTTENPKVGATTLFRLSAAAGDGRGNLRFVAKFGEPGGTLKSRLSEEEPCRKEKSITQRTWPISHQYSKPGLYRVRMTVYLDCNGYKATAALPVRVRE
jgi:hypothetical protein